MLLLVLDTDVMFAAFDSPIGASRRLVEMVLDGTAVMIASVALFLEYEAVLTRPESLRRFDLSRADVTDVLDHLSTRIRPTGFDFRWRPAAADPDDDLVLETAVNGCADIIASFNIKDLRDPASRFGIDVERPAVILRRFE